MANEKVHFTVALKTLDVSIGEDGTPLQDVRDKVKPFGEYYFINPHIELRPDDWVVWGVASTDDVDLQSELVDVKEVFGDFLQEFVETGKIFYEHGYRLAGKVEPHNRIDEPIGVPYMVEIFDNSLYVWVLLDKNHDLARKVWESMQASDERMKKWGFSIGGIYVGSPKAMHDPVYGKVVKLPKIRLYEISITPQPVNTKTWATIVKSFIDDEVSEDEMDAKKAKEHVDPAATPTKTEVIDDKTPLPDNLLDGEKPEFGADGKPGAPEPERIPGSEVVKGKATEDDMEEKEVKQEDKELEEAPKEDVEQVDEETEEKATEEDVQEEKEEPAQDEGTEGQEFTPEAKEEETAAGGEDEGAVEDEGGDNALAQLLGEDEGSAGGSTDDAALDVVLDKVDMLTAAIRRIEESVQKLMEVESQEHGEDLTEEAPGEEEVSDVEEIIAKAVTKAVEEAVAPVLDTLELITKSLVAQKSLSEEIEYLKGLIKQVTGNEAKYANLQRDEAISSEVENALKSREAAKVAKSITSNDEVEDSVVIQDKATSPNDVVLKALFSTDVDIDVLLPSSTKKKFAEIASSEDSVQLVKDLVGAYKSLESKRQQKVISKSSYDSIRTQIFNNAKATLDLNEEEFLLLVEN